jgi:hypothetical protein
MRTPSHETANVRAKEVGICGLSVAATKRNDLT